MDDASAVLAHLLPAGRRISGGGVPSRAVRPCTAFAGALRGEPLPITTGNGDTLMRGGA
ncbi:hypothetical protein [Streptomyces variegatus]|uniref:hypothetical protein n=1 Tax=Streptomyces variegatus TaxID=284040 RepID=UPI003C2FA795